MIAVAVPSPSVRAYLRASNIACVAVLADGTVTAVCDVGRLQQPASDAWWTTAASALAIMRHCREHGTIDVLAVAGALHIPITPHAVAVERAQCAVERIDAALVDAKRRGALSFLNSGYRDARRAARDEGKCFPCYALVLERFKRALYKAATGGKSINDRSLIQQALGAVECDDESERMAHRT
jgi:hypothetical protein